MLKAKILSSLNVNALCEKVQKIFQMVMMVFSLLLDC